MSIILKQAKKFTCAKFISKYFKFLKEEINTALARHRTYRQVINELNMCFTANSQVSELRELI